MIQHDVTNSISQQYPKIAAALNALRHNPKPMESSTTTSADIHNGSLSVFNIFHPLKYLQKLVLNSACGSVASPRDLSSLTELFNLQLIEILCGTSFSPDHRDH
jgi:hypothetical protein